ncbi:hypothetical protein A2422_03565 [Candidatus Woesebacteria bacterium RIFOXYC1_FULL_31_51]|nr:MAG: DHHA1 domain protein [Candidatus Woesebacteria bacterium GW2011_GWF1_31_35]KKP23284.1 MAG: DHHA1 domain protein [Candidatus Woesebacteria bacterium GW2011_GWC1_30_29]KKP26197.1 MAG: DHHA1 domain protein [Candidatus Woesebacteria bacterium GW2011_GWD1_31_12]KKP27546.1 MAG: DHHA1 domain protein [Candidatus Woesebacteria bacterium GW2011_GWB1_31_29]KKP34398.1 MAG: DHHA1 domain protein [Candidatus Woesebacteria bacterium GW2011_GWF2_32_16]KKP34425.1 MAG: DHHA1 domain protein [Candidatus Wo
MDNSFKNLIDSASEVLILLPSESFVDQVSAGLSLYLTLRPLKNVSISSLNPMTAEFSRLIGVDKIGTEVGSKNLTIKFTNYQAEDVDKVSYDIENGQFKLTVSPKSGLNSPTKEQIDISYSGVGADTVILIGGENETSFPILSNPEFKDAKIIHIGIRFLEVTSDLQILSFASPASGVSELMANLIKESGLSIDPDIATNLLSGIEDSSKNFQGSDVTALTFEIFAELLKLGGIRMPKILSSDNFPKGSIPTKPFTNVRSQQVKQVEKTTKVEEQKEEEVEEIPQSWTEPKVYTGTSVS